MLMFTCRPFEGRLFWLTFYKQYVIVETMYEFLKQALIGWNCQKDQRHKLQQAYLAAVFVGLILAGCLTLLNIQQGRLIAMVAAGFALIFLVNGIAWALLEAFIAPNLPKAESSASKTRRRK